MGLDLDTRTRIIVERNRQVVEEHASDAAYAAARALTPEAAGEKAFLIGRNLCQVKSKEDAGDLWVGQTIFCGPPGVEYVVQLAPCAPEDMDKLIRMVTRLLYASDADPRALDVAHVIQDFIFKHTTPETLTDGMADLLEAAMHPSMSTAAETAARFSAWIFEWMLPGSARAAAGVALPYKFAHLARVSHAANPRGESIPHRWIYGLYVGHALNQSSVCAAESWPVPVETGSAEYTLSRVTYVVSRRAVQELCTNTSCASPLRRQGAARNRCSVCDARYCCRECQRMDWADHKWFCRAVQRGEVPKVVNA